MKTSEVYSMAPEPEVKTWNPKYRMLKEGETILSTDEVQNDDATWKPTICAGQSAPSPSFTAHRIYRRKNIG